MSLFIKLSDIGLTSVLSFFDLVINFFNTPVNSLLVREVTSGVLGLFQNIGLLNFGAILETIFGVNLSLPLWEFLLANIGIILSLTVFLRFINLLFPL